MSDDKCETCGYAYTAGSNGSHQCDIELLGQVDLMIDEFLRIKAISTDGEIDGLCDRAISRINRRFTVFDSLKSQAADIERLRELLKAAACPDCDGDGAMNASAH